MSENKEGPAAAPTTMDTSEDIVTEPAPTTVNTSENAQGSAPTTFDTTENATGSASTTTFDSSKNAQGPAPTTTLDSFENAQESDPTTFDTNENAQASAMAVDTITIDLTNDVDENAVGPSSADNRVIGPNSFGERNFEDFICQLRINNLNYRLRHMVPRSAIDILRQARKFENDCIPGGATSQACDFTPAFFDRPLTNRELGVFIESTMVDQTFVKELKDQLKKMKGFAYEEYSYITENEDTENSTPGNTVEPVTQGIDNTVSENTVAPVAQDINNTVSENTVAPVAQGINNPVSENTVEPATQDINSTVPENTAMPVTQNKNSIEYVFNSIDLDAILSSSTSNTTKIKEEVKEPEPDSGIPEISYPSASLSNDNMNLENNTNQNLEAQELTFSECRIGQLIYVREENRLPYTAVILEMRPDSVIIKSTYHDSGPVTIKLADIIMGKVEFISA